jgi:putative membrane protein
MKRKMRIAAALSGLIALSAVPAIAQMGNPGGMTPGTVESAPGTPAPGQTNNTDRLFARLAAAGGLAEVDFGTLAGKKAQGDARDFARRMVDDHSRANKQLTDLARQAGIPLPTELDPDHRAARANLDKAERAQFDTDYMSSQVLDHIKTVQLLKWEINSGQDADLQHFASAQLPIVLDHLRMAQDVLIQLRSRTAR